MVDTSDSGITPSVLFMIDHSVVAGTGKSVLSRRLQFVRMDASGAFSYAGWAPHLDLSPTDDRAREIARKILAQPWLVGDIGKKAEIYATGAVVKPHYDEVRRRQTEKLAKLERSVRSQLVKAVEFYSHKYVEYSELAHSANPPPTAAALAETMRRKADELSARLKRREAEIEDARNVVSLPPSVKGGILVIPAGLLDAGEGRDSSHAQPLDAEARRRVELAAMKAVMDAERALGNTVIDVSAEQCGWDLTSRFPEPQDGSPRREDRHIEVKGRVKGADTVTLTHNEICYAVNQRDKFILAIVLVDGDKVEGPFYVRDIWENELNFGVAKEDYQIATLMTKALRPEETI